jgi:uncharacterized membrane protein (UPF0182 family)
LGAVVIVALLVVFFSANRVAVLLTDLWWFEERGVRQVFVTLLSTRVLLAGTGTLLMVALVAVNLMIARRLRPFIVPLTPQQAQVQRLREALDPLLPWAIAAVAVAVGLTSGLALGAQWETYLLWSNGSAVGVTDPQFSRDLAFWLFELPWWRLVQAWLLSAVVLTTLLSAGAHYLLGGIRADGPLAERALPSVRVHLSALLAVILGLRAWGYWLSRFELNYSARGTVTGASFTDINAELPALNLLIGVSVVAIVLLAVSLRRRSLLLPGSAIALLIVASLVLQGAYPAAIQRFRVDPQELDREAPFIERNLAATRAAYGLDAVELRPFSIANDLDAADVSENDVTLANVRLWDPDVLSTTYSELQSLRPYYEFNEVAIDRYTIDGELRQVMIATRELSALPEQADTWQNRHLTYTHGFGIVASQVNTANSEGQPVFLASNIPPTGVEEVVPVEQPGVYFGEFAAPPFSLVRTLADELDYEDPRTQEQVTTTYAGLGGVPIDSIGRRLAYALRFGDYNLVLTNLLTEDSRIIHARSVTERARKVAPFLEIDASPYPVVLDGRIVWILDAYTTSDAYPYSERQVLEVADGPRIVNYVRNSVKATVDAYDGKVTLYRVGDDDPLIDAWSAAFPGLVRPLSEAPVSLAQHFRYPQDLFRLQSQLFTRYHIPTAEAFYNRADEWEIPTDPAFAANQGASELGGTTSRPLAPSYLLMRLPGASTEEFVLIQPYLARERPNMVAWLAGRSDAERLGDLFAVRFPSDQQVLGPLQAQARIEQDDEISAYITLRSREGSNVIRGNLQVLPIADSILYVQPLFLQNPQARIPELARVAVVMGVQTAFDRTLSGALAQLLGTSVPDSLGDGIGEGEDGATEGGVPGGPTVEVPEELVRQALEAFGRADEALREGDLAAYQREIAAARRLLERIAELQGGTLLPPDAGTGDGTDPEAGTGDGTGDEALLEGATFRRD